MLGHCLCSKAEHFPAYKRVGNNSVIIAFGMYTKLLMTYHSAHQSTADISVSSIHTYTQDSSSIYKGRSLPNSPKGVGISEHPFFLVG